MNTTQIEFIKDRLTKTAQSYELISVFLSPAQYNIMDIVRAVQGEGYLCQTLSTEHAQRIGPKLLIEMAETFIKHKVVVILQCQNQEELREFVPVIEEWKLHHSTLDETRNDRGRLWILVNNVDVNQLDSYMQNIADFTCILNEDRHD